MGSHPVRLIRFQDDWVLLSAEFQTSSFFLSRMVFEDNVSQDLTPPRNNSIIDTAMALINANGVRYIIHEISGWSKYEVLAQTPNQISRPEGGRQQVWCSFHENTLVFSVSSHLLQLLSQCPLSHMSFFPDTCLPFPLVFLSHLLLCRVELFVFGGLFMGGRNTPLLQAASSLSAHHTEHDSPPSLWCWDELFLLSPRGVKIFCFTLSFLNLTSRQADR